jgi:voltage-gated potassium channel
VSVLFIVVLIAALNLVAENRPLRWVGLTLFIASVSTMGAGILLGIPALLGAGRITSMVFLGVTVWAILPRLFEVRRVTAGVLWGALSVYLIIGVMGAFAFGALSVWDPEALDFPLGAPLDAESVIAGDLVYFSFVTQTTLGYGDITPVSALARAIAMFLAIGGVLYVAVFVATLVGVYVSQSRKPEA